MPNYNPKTKQLNPFPMVYDKPLGKRSISVRVLEEDYLRFMQIPTKVRTKKLRDCIRELISEQEASQSQSSKSA